MPKSLLPIECHQAFKNARAFASAVNWPQQEADIREMLKSITDKVNKLHAWENRRKLILPHDYYYIRRNSDISEVKRIKKRKTTTIHPVRVQPEVCASPSEPHQVLEEPYSPSVYTHRYFVLLPVIFFNYVLSLYIYLC